MTVRDLEGYILVRKVVNHNYTEKLYKTVNSKNSKLVIISNKNEIFTQYYNEDGITSPVIASRKSEHFKLVR